MAVGSTFTSLYQFYTSLGSRAASFAQTHNLPQTDAEDLTQAFSEDLFSPTSPHITENPHAERRCLSLFEDHFELHQAMIDAASAAPNSEAARARAGLIHYFSITTEEDISTLALRRGLVVATLQGQNINDINTLPSPTRERVDVLKDHLTLRIPYLGLPLSGVLLDKIARRTLEQEETESSTALTPRRPLPSQDLINKVIRDIITKLEQVATQDSSVDILPVVTALREEEMTYQNNSRDEMTLVARHYKARSTALVTELAAARQALKDATIHHQDLEEQNQALREAVADAEAHQHRMLSDLERNLRAEISQRDAQINKLNTKIESLQNDVAEAQRNYTDLSAQKSAAEERITSLDSEVLALKAQRDELSQENRGLRGDISERDQKIQDLNETINAIEIERDDLKDNVTALKAQVQDTDRLIGSLQQKLATLHQDQGHLTDENNDLRDQVTERDLIIDDLRESIKTLNHANLDLSKTTQSLRHEITQMRTQYDAAKASVASLEQALADLRQKHADQEAAIEALRRELAEKQGALEKAKDDLENALKRERDNRERFRKYQIATQKKIQELIEKLRLTDDRHARITSELRASQDRLERALANEETRARRIVAAAAVSLEAGGPTTVAPTYTPPEGDDPEKKKLILKSKFEDRYRQLPEASQTRLRRQFQAASQLLDHLKYDFIIIDRTPIKGPDPDGKFSVQNLVERVTVEVDGHREEWIKKTYLKIVKKPSNEDDFGLFLDGFANSLMYPNLVNDPQTSPIPVATSYADDEGFSLYFSVVAGVHPTHMNAHAMFLNPQGEGNALRLMAYLLEPLEKLHTKGITHRDIKPENLLYDHHDLENPHTTLIDMDLSRDTHEAPLSPDSRLSGTYLAPEISDVDSPTATIDIYAMGVTFYEIFTGRDPGAGLAQCIWETLSDEQKPKNPYHTLNPEALNALPASIQSIIRRATSTDPSERYQNASEMISACNLAYKALPKSDSAEGPSLVVEEAGEELGDVFVTQPYDDLAEAQHPRLDDESYVHVASGVVPKEANPAQKIAKG